MAETVGGGGQELITYRAGDMRKLPVIMGDGLQEERARDDRQSLPGMTLTVLSGIDRGGTQQTNGPNLTLPVFRLPVHPIITSALAPYWESEGCRF